MEGDGGECAEGICPRAPIEKTDTVTQVGYSSLQRDTTDLNIHIWEDS